MSTQPIDYAALADQARQQAAPKVDYSALAEQARTSAPAAKPSFFQRVGLVPDSSNNGAGVGEKEMQGGVGDAVISGMGDASKRMGAAYVNHGPAEVVRGIGDMASGEISKGGHRVMTGAGITLAPLAPEAIAAAPGAAALAAAGGIVAGKTAKGVSSAVGATPDQQAFIEDLANFAGGYAGAKAGGVAKSIASAIKPSNPGELADVATRGLTGMVPGLNKFSRFRSPTVEEVLGALKKAYATGDAPIPKELEPYVSSPYAKSGDQLTDATTVMPRKILGPDRQLNAAPEPAAATPATAPAAPPATAKVLKDAGVTQAMKEAGVAAPGASIRPVRPGITGDLAPRPDISFPPGLSGEDAANMQLTRYNINELRFMAQKRGLPVSPKDTHTDLIGKLSESLTPGEVQGFASAAAQSKPVVSKFPENNQMAANLNQAASALQEAKGSPYEVASLRSAASTIANHPANIAEVDLTANKIRGIDKRIGKRINDFFSAQKDAQVPTPQELAPEVPQVPQSSEQMMDLMRRTLAARAGAK